MQRKLIVSLMLILGFLGIGFGIAVTLVRTAPEPTQVDLTRPALLVKTVQLAPSTVVEPIVGYGTAQAEKLARLSAQVAGEIVVLDPALRVGVQVAKDQVLIRIDDREYRQQQIRAESALVGVEAQLAELETQDSNIEQLLTPARRELASAEWEFNKVKDLYQREVAPKREFEQGQLILEQTRRMVQGLENQKALLPSQRAQLEATRQNRQADLEIARLNVARCTIRAPFDGQLAEKTVEVGERVQIGSPLMTVLDPNLIEIPIELPISVRPKVWIGSACELTLPGQSGPSWKGRVKRLAPQASEVTRTFKLYARVDNTGKSQSLVPGYFVRARIEGPTYRDVLVVPRACIQQGQVFVWRDGKAAAREVRVQEQFGDQSIVSGLQSGDIVITSNQDALYEGAAVRLDATIPPAATRPEPVAALEPSTDTKTQAK